MSVFVTDFSSFFKEVKKFEILAGLLSSLAASAILFWREIVFFQKYGANWREF